jgi:hypothetical protein
MIWLGFTALYAVSVFVSAATYSLMVDEVDDDTFRGMIFIAFIPFVNVALGGLALGQFIRERRK